MTLRSLLFRNLRFHKAAHTAAIAGAAVAAAALVGALLIGDSVRETLRRNALQRIAGADFAVSSGDGLFRSQLASIDETAAPLLLLPATAEQSSGKARAGKVQAVGIDSRYSKSVGKNVTVPQPGEALLSPSLARQLNAARGDEIVIRIQKPGLFSTDAALAPGKDKTAGLRLRVAGVLSGEEGGNLSIQGSGIEAMNVFLPLEELSTQAGSPGSANLLLISAPPGSNRTRKADEINQAIRSRWTLKDAGLQLSKVAGGGLELTSTRVFLSEAVVAAAKSLPQKTAILTYLANLLEHGTNSTPYSMVTAAGPPFTPQSMRDDEILLSSWLAEDLHATPGDTIRLSYFLPDSGLELREATNSFRVAGIVPATLPYLDPGLMPRFPGLEDAAREEDWDAGFPLTYKIRDKDEVYWREHKGAPKAFITLAAGRKIWANRFGSLTSIRFEPISTNQAAATLLKNLEPANVGISVRDLKTQALSAAGQAQDFSQLFLAFSFFIIGSALLLLALLSRFGLESRSAEIAILAAVGFSRSLLRWLYLLEALLISLAGILAGIVLGIVYAKGLLWALSGVWSPAAGGLKLALVLQPGTLVAGAAVSLILCALVIWFALRSQTAQPVCDLLRGPMEHPQGAAASRMWRSVTAIAFLGAAAMIAWSLASPQAEPDRFFTAGFLLLVFGLGVLRELIGRHSRKASLLTRWALSLRSVSRRPRRSLAVAGLLASGTFVLLAVTAFYLGPEEHQHAKTSGLGGFDLIGSASLPITRSLQTREGLQALGLEDLPKDLSVVPFRVHDGDEASCLNLNRALQPSLLGVRPELLKGRFKFQEVARGLGAAKGWELLRTPESSREAIREVPAIGDASSIQWSMGKRVGDTIEMRDEFGNAFRLRIVAGLSSSILQGKLVIDESQFLKLFPGTSGHRYFLIETPRTGAPANVHGQISETLTRALQDYGFEATPAATRMAALNAVQNTYLSTFQILGGLGLLLGSLGLGILVLRNALERRAELAVMQASGFRKSQLVLLLAGESGILLVAGLLIGCVAAIAAIVPAILRGEMDWVPFVLGFAVILVNGLLWAWGAAAIALRGPLLGALRNE